MTRRFISIAAISLLLGLVFDFLFYGNVPGISVLVFSLLIMVSGFYFNRLHSVTLPTSVYVLVPFVLLFSTMVFLRASGLLIFFDIIIVLYLLLVILRLMALPDLKLWRFTFNDYLDRMLVVPVSFPKALENEVRGAFKEPIKFKELDHYKPYVRGALISLPILLIFVLLLSSADLVFKRFVDSIFSFHISLNPVIVNHIIIIAVITVVLASAYAWFFSPGSLTSDIVAGKPSRLKLSQTESLIIIGSVSVLFLIFLIVQVTYLFGGSSHFAATGLTYADYARKGFFELIAVAVISMLLILEVKSITIVTSDKRKLSFKLLFSGLIAEVMIIMVSAHIRLSLYENAYGFTRLRLFSHLFIGWLAVAFILLLVYIVREEREHRFAFRLFLTVLAFFAVFNIVNPDALIARENISRYQATGKIDTSYLNVLSDDAIPTMTRLLTTKNVAVHDAVAAHLYQRHKVLTTVPSNWPSADLSHIRAKRLLIEHLKDLKTINAVDLQASPLTID